MRSGRAAAQTTQADSLPRGGWGKLSRARVLGQGGVIAGAMKITEHAIVSGRPAVGRPGAERGEVGQRDAAHSPSTGRTQPPRLSETVHTSGSVWSMVMASDTAAYPALAGDLGGRPRRPHRPTALAARLRRTPQPPGPVRPAAAEVRYGRRRQRLTDGATPTPPAGPAPPPIPGDAEADDQQGGERVRTGVPPDEEGFHDRTSRQDL